MIFNPNINQRKNIRLKEYDYSQNGMYFITICTQNREQILSKINVETKYLNAVHGVSCHKELDNTNTFVGARGTVPRNKN